METQSSGSDRIPTGLAGFDGMSEGGFPDNSINIVTGRGGSGKTLFCVHFVLEGANRDEKSVYVSVDDSEESVLRAASQFDIGLADAVAEGSVELYGPDSLMERTGQGLVDFDDLTRSIDQLVGTAEASRLVVDSIAGLGVADSSVNEMRRNMIRFIQRVRENDVCALFVSEKWKGRETRYGIEEYLGDSLVVLGLDQHENQLTRSLQIRKMRYTDHDKALRPVEISGDGMVVHETGQVF